MTKTLIAAWVTVAVLLTLALYFTFTAIWTIDGEVSDRYASTAGVLWFLVVLGTAAAAIGTESWTTSQARARSAEAGQRYAEQIRAEREALYETYGRAQEDLLADLKAQGRLVEPEPVEPEFDPDDARYESTQGATMAEQFTEEGTST